MFSKLLLLFLLELDWFFFSLLEVYILSLFFEVFLLSLVIIVLFFDFDFDFDLDLLELLLISTISLLFV